MSPRALRHGPEGARRPSLLCGDRALPFHRTLVMGVLNVTPDSFSDGGRFHRAGSVDLDAVTRAAEAMLADGADILDVGGESTRPGARGVCLDRELRRVMPVVERLLGLGTIVSVDTSKPEVARAVLGAGCHMINDVTGLADERMLEALAGSSAAVCIMHMRGEPRTMQQAPRYGDVVAEVGALLEARVGRARDAGIHQRRICVDPGFGFGKTLAHNLTLLRGLEAVRTGDLPLLVGLSRKRMIGEVTGAPVTDRVAGSVAAAVLAAQRGADIVRVHDVAETVAALKVLEAVES